MSKKCFECNAKDDDNILTECRVCGILYCKQCMVGDICAHCESNLDDGQRCPHEKVD